MNSCPPTRYLLNIQLPLQYSSPSLLIALRSLAFNGEGDADRQGVRRHLRMRTKYLIQSIRYA
jgi:hypothetical protein